jgi:hypothetical protein
VFQYVNDVVQLVKSYRSQTRTFVVGISDEISRHNIHSIARAGGGAYVCIGAKESSSEINEKAARLLQKMTQVVLSEVDNWFMALFFLLIPFFKAQIEWQVNEQEKTRVEQGPKEMQSIFSGHRQIFYALLPSPCTR